MFSILPVFRLEVTVVVAADGTPYLADAVAALSAAPSYRATNCATLNLAATTTIGDVRVKKVEDDVRIGKCFVRATRIHYKDCADIPKLWQQTTDCEISTTCIFLPL